MSALARLLTLAAMALAVTGLVRLFGGGDEHGARLASRAAQGAGADPVLQMANAWMGEIGYAPSYAALNPYAEASAETASSAFDPADDYWGLPRSEGHETVAAYCAACHSLQIVMAQRQSREGWDYLLTWMVDKQGMAAPAPEMRDEMLVYLTREFGPGGN